MNTKNLLATITITALFTFGLGYVTGQQNDNSKFTIHKTRSGMFIVDDTAQSKGKMESKIYEVLELPTNRKSFQEAEEYMK
jgi:hypothetical protein